MLYRRCDVWEPVDERTVLVYRCWQNLHDGRYAVQSADFLRIDNVDGLAAGYLDRQMIELFAEQPPDERSSSHETLAAAIEHHQRDFAR